MTVLITFPLDDEQAASICAAALAFGVEPWEMAMHVLKWRERLMVTCAHCGQYVDPDQADEHLAEHENDPKEVERDEHQAPR